MRWDFLTSIDRRKKSAGSAKERLKLVLIHDRTDLTPGALRSLKDELIEVISRYVEIDPSSVSIKYAKEGRSQRLVADIPMRTKNDSALIEEVLDTGLHSWYIMQIFSYLSNYVSNVSTQCPI